MSVASGEAVTYGAGKHSRKPFTLSPCSLHEKEGPDKRPNPPRKTPKTHIHIMKNLSFGLRRSSCF